MSIGLNINFKGSESGGYACHRVELQKLPNKRFVDSRRILVSEQKPHMQFQVRQKDGE